MTSFQLTEDPQIVRRDDGLLCRVELDHYQAFLAAGGVPTPIPLAQQKTSLVAKIDADVDSIYAALLGNREAEYTLAEKEATAYRAAGYTGTVPASVQAWSTAKVQTATWATDDILSAAATWRTAQVAIRANRLALKEAARNAVDAAALATVQAQWAWFLAVIKPQLGL